MLVFGPGLGATTVAASIAALSDVPEQYAGVASGTNTAAFQLGGALGSAVATTVAVTEGLGGAFVAAAAFAVLALVASVGLLRPAAVGGPVRWRPAPPFCGAHAALERLIEDSSAGSGRARSARVDFRSHTER
jgi:MFS family permease